jgi:hypothetical protein
VALHFYLELNNTAFSEHEWLVNWSLSNFYQNNFSVAGGNQFYTFPNLLYGLFPLFQAGFFSLNVVLLFLLFKSKAAYSRKQLLILLLPLVAYTVFLIGIPFQNNRFLLITYPLLLVILFPAFQKFWDLIGAHRRWILPLLICIQLGLFVRAIKPTIDRKHLENEIALGMRGYKSQTLYTFDIDVALKGNGLNFTYKNLWTAKYETFEIGALALFSEDKLALAWSEKTPMMNWNELKKNYKLKQLKTFDQGWKLFRIEEAN